MMMNRAFRFILSNRILCSALVLGAVVAAGRQLPSLKVNNLIDTFLAAEDPGLVFYHETIKRFVGDHNIYIALEHKDRSIFETKILRMIKSLAGELEQVKGVHRVQSLATVDSFRHIDGDIRIDKLLRQVPRTPAEVASIKKEVEGSPIIRNLVSTDGNSSLFVVELESDLIKRPEQQSVIVKEIRSRCLRRQTAEVHFRFAGSPVNSETFDYYNQRVQKIFTSLMILLVGIFSFVFLRRLTATLLPLVVVIVTSVCTMGVFTWFGFQTNVVTSIITPVLFLVSVSDAIHILERYYREMPAAATKREAILVTMRALALPCFLTSLTTAAGFGSLITNQVQPVKQFGLFSALGVVLALLVSFIFLPILLSIGQKKPAPGAPPAARAASPCPAPKGPAPSRFLHALDQLVKEHRWGVIFFFVAIMVPTMIGITRIRVETNLLKYFEDDVTLVKDNSFIDEQYTGSAPLDIIIDTKKKDGAITPKMLLRLEALQDLLEATPGVARGVGLTDYIKEIHQALIDGRQESYKIPELKQGISQLLLLPKRTTLEPYVDLNNRYLRLSTRLYGGIGLNSARKILKTIEDNGAFPDGATMRITGSSALFIHMDEYLVWGQIESFALIFGFLCLAMVVIFRSVRLGLLAMIPNVIPILVTLSMMGWLDIPLDGCTVMVASIAIGIGVDDTIHFLIHLQREIRAGASVGEAVTSTFQAVGPALIYTSIILAIGFGVFIFADFVPTRHFGMLTGITMIVALAADLLLLTACLQALPGALSGVQQDKKEA